MTYSKRRLLCLLLGAFCTALLAQFAETTESDAQARCWNADEIALYHNGKPLFTAKFDMTLRLPHSAVHIGPTSVLAFGCCTKTTPSPRSPNVSSYGMMFSSVYDHVLVTDIDWRCVHSDKWIDDFQSTMFNDSLWQDAYVIESNNAHDHPGFQFPYDGIFEPYAKWIWAEKQTGEIPSVYGYPIQPNCAFCRANSIAKRRNEPVVRTMVLFKSSLELEFNPQSIYGMNFKAFNFTFELYASSPFVNGTGRDEDSCVRSGKIIFILCGSASNGTQIVIHFGVNMTNTSEMRLCTQDAKNMTESCELLARAPFNPLKCRQYEYFWTQILPTNSVEVGIGRWFGDKRLLSGDMGTPTCSHITHIQLQHDQRESPVYLRIHRNTSRDDDRLLGENECLVLPHELGDLRVCGDGYITNPEDCGRCHCCSFWNDTDPDKESSFLCYVPMSSVLLQGKAAKMQTGPERREEEFCNRGFLNAIGKFNITTDKDRISSDTELTFYISVQRVIRGMTILLDFNDGQILSDVSLNKSSDGREVYYNAVVNHLYECPPGKVFKPTLVLQGHNRETDVLNTSVTIALTEDDCAVLCFSDTSQPNISFAIFVDERKSYLNKSIDFGDGHIESDLNVTADVSDLPPWTDSCLRSNYSVAVLHHIYDRIGEFRLRLSVSVCSALNCERSVVVGTLEDFRRYVGAIKLLPLPRSHTSVSTGQTLVNFLIFVESFDPDMMVSVDFGDDTGILEVPQIPDMSLPNATLVFQRPGEYMSSVNHTYVSNDTVNYTASVVVQHRRIPSWRLQKSCTVTFNGSSTPLVPESDDITFDMFFNVTGSLTDLMVTSSPNESLPAPDSMPVATRSPASTNVSVLSCRTTNTSMEFSSGTMTEVEACIAESTRDPLGKDQGKKTTSKSLADRDIYANSSASSDMNGSYENVNQLFVLQSAIRSFYPLDKVEFFMITNKNLTVEIDFGDHTPATQMTFRNLTDVLLRPENTGGLQDQLVMTASHQYAYSGLYFVRADVVGQNDVKPFSSTVRVSILKYNVIILENNDETHLENSEVTFVIALEESIGRKDLLIDFGDRTAFKRIILQKFYKAILPTWAKLILRQRKRTKFVAHIFNNYTIRGNYLVRLLLKDGALQSTIAKKHMRIFTVEEVLNGIEVLFLHDHKDVGTLLIQTIRPVKDIAVQWNFGNTTLSDTLSTEKTTDLLGRASLIMKDTNFSIDTNSKQLSKHCSITAPCYVSLMQHSFEGWIPRFATVNSYVTTGKKNISKTRSLTMNNSSMDLNFIVIGDGVPLTDPISIWQTREFSVHILFPQQVANNDLISTLCVVKDSDNNSVACNKQILHNRLKKSLELKLPANTLYPGNYTIMIEGKFLDPYGIKKRVNSTSHVIVFLSPLVASLQASKLVYTVDETLMLDASNSFDPNAKASEGLEFFWTCFKDYDRFTRTSKSKKQHDFGDCIAEEEVPATLHDRFHFPVSHLNLAHFPEKFHFMVLVSKAAIPSSSASLTITVPPGSAPVIDIVCVKNCKPYITLDSVLSFNCSNCGKNERLKLSWIFGGLANDSLEDSPSDRRNDVYEVELRSLAINPGIVNLTVTRADRTSGTASFVIRASPEKQGSISKAKTADSSTSSLLYLIFVCLVVPVLVFVVWLKHRASRRIAPRTDAYRAT